MERSDSVLLVDDDILSNQIQSLMLEDLGIWNNILTSLSREDAIKLLSDCVNKKECIPSYIFVDLNMPGISMEEFINEIKCLPYSVDQIPPQIVVISAYMEKEHQRDLMIKGIEHFIVKPITSEKINVMNTKAEDDKIGV